MMTPVYLSSQASSSFPLLEIQEDHHQQTHQLMKIFLSSSSSSSPHNDFNPSLPYPAHHFQDTSGSQFAMDQSQVCLLDKVVMDQSLIPHGGSLSTSDHRSSCEQGQGLSIFPPADQTSDQEINSHQSNNNNNNLTLKWMSSKMRIIHKMKRNSPNNCTTREWSSGGDSLKRSEEVRYSGTSNITTTNGAVRVCSDCSTTTTPLWRSGPRGPKSLCNACGIRQRKARRAMEAAAAANGTASIATSSSKPHHKLEKKPLSNKNHHHASSLAHHFKRHCAEGDSPPPLADHEAGKKKQFLFETLAIGLSESDNCTSSSYGRVFPENEAEAAALLLMELSRGLLQA